MALPYKRWTEEEVTTRNIVDDGNYPFEIVIAITKDSRGGNDKNGNPKPIHKMLEIDFIFWDINGVIKKQRDWIVFMENMDWKLRHLANTTGLLELYENGELDSHHLAGRKGVFTLGSKEIFADDGTKKKVNFVKDYVKKANLETSGDFIDDDIPI